MAGTSTTSLGTGPKITVVTTMKDEGPYILDWIAHYKTLGVTDFVVFTNDCSDSTDHILRCLNRAGVVEHRFNRVMRRGPHKSALMWAQYEQTVLESDWIMVIDVDEYLQINSGDGTLPGLIDQYPEADAISFVWRVFGNAGVKEIEATPVPQNFTLTQHERGDINENRFFKTMHRNTSKFERLGVHRPFLAEDAKDVRWILPNGQRLTEEQIATALFVYEDYGYEGAQLNHYALRSQDALLNKKARGRANHHTQGIAPGYWKKFDKNDVQDATLAENFGAAMNVKARLLRDATLRKYHEEALVWHRDQAARLRKKQEVKAFLQTIEGVEDEGQQAA